MGDYRSIRIVFMGTPEFAVASLDAMVKAGCNVVGVVTAADKPAGRGMKLTETAVKKYAKENNLPLLQPIKLKDPGFVNDLKAMKADLQVVVAFRMLPEVIWNMPHMGTINLHGSLLPQYRGAAPINWAIINGEKETGVTTFKLRHEIDMGDILLQESFPVGEDETAGEVHDKMKIIGAALLVQTIKSIADGSIAAVSQTSILNSQYPAGVAEQDLKTAPKIHTETCRINWDQTVEEVHNLVRGLSPFPGAFTVMNEKMLKIFRSKKELAYPSIAEGEYETDGKSFLKIACSNGYLHLLEVQLEGKKRMNVEEFLKGYRFNQ